ncbi:hypothetical protein ABBQ32_003836 [Trebouxia sp. C0010 RCD-2024]
MASSPAHLQALIDALGDFSDMLYMEISVAKTRVMVVSKSSIVFTCNSQPTEQVQTFKYLGLHFHASGDISHLINPLRAKAAGSWAVVQRMHSQLQCGNMVNLKLQLLQSIWTPSIHFGCELWGMHRSTVALANKSRTDLQRIYATKAHLWGEVRHSQCYVACRVGLVAFTGFLVAANLAVLQQTSS